jgi:hypothetical protein
MAFTPDQNHYINQAKEHFLLAIGTGNTIPNITEEDVKIARVQSALNSMRMAIEAIANYMIVDTSTISNNFIKNSNLKGIISKLKDEDCFHKQDTDKNQVKALDFYKINYGGNNGSHIQQDKNSSPTITDYNICKELTKSTIKWFYESICQQSIPSDVNDAINNEIVPDNYIPKYDDWYEIYENNGQFRKSSTQYGLITGENFSSRELSEHEKSAFVLADINWHLIIDFNPESQKEGGLCAYYREELGLAKQRIYHRDVPTNQIDFTSNPKNPIQSWYLAQQNGITDKPILWGSKNRRLGNVINKSKEKSMHKKFTLLIMVDNYQLVAEALRLVAAEYTGESETVSLIIISRTQSESLNAKEALGDFDQLFSNVEFYTIDYSTIVSGLSKVKRRDFLREVANKSFVVPGFNEEKQPESISISLHMYDEFATTKFFELVHKDIGKNIPQEKPNSFYLGNTIQWGDLAYRNGIGKDISREKLDVITADLKGLLSNASTCHKMKLIHEPSAGGTTLARRIAYDIGTEEYPTVILKRYHRTETYKGFEQLYDLVNNKPILVIAEQSDIHQNDIEDLEKQIKRNRKHAVILYVQRSIKGSIEKKEKSRVLKSTLDDKEQEEFEIVFSEIAPSKAEAIKNIKKNLDRNFVTPFLYGLTAFEERFLQLSRYIKSLLLPIKEDYRKVVTYICLIGKYSNQPIPISIFEAAGFKLNGFGADDNILHLLKFNDDTNSFEARHYLIADEVCRQALSGFNLSNKDEWRLGLKSFLFEIIDLFARINSEEMLEDVDKNILESVFISKADSNDSGGPKEKFSYLIIEVNKTDGEGTEMSLEIIKYLTKKIPFHPYFHQHLAMLYIYSAYDKRDPLPYYDLAIESANKAIYIEPSPSSSLYHTKGHVYVRKLSWYSKNHKLLLSRFDEDVNSTLEEIKYCFDEGYDSLIKCVSIDNHSKYGYSSMVYLVIHTFDCGYKISGYNNLSDFIHDFKYDWFGELLPIGMDAVNQAHEIAKNIDDKTQLENIQKSYEKLSQLYGDTNYQDYEDKEQSAKSESMRAFYRHSFVTSILSNFDFTNPAKTWSNIADKDKLVPKIVEKLQSNMRYKPSMYGLKRYMEGVRMRESNTSIDQAILFLDEIYKKECSEEKNNKILLGELAYYLCILNAIQTLKNTESLDSNYIVNASKYLEESRNLPITNHDNTFEYEWLGNTIDNTSFSGLVSRKRLGAFNTNGFTPETFLLQEVRGKIMSVGKSGGGKERVNGKIRFAQHTSGKYFQAYFVPIKGGWVEGASDSERFDDKKYEENQEVMFFLGFSRAGFRAWNPIPYGKQRAKVNHRQGTISKEKKPQVFISDNEIYDMRVKTVNKQTGIINGSISQVGPVEIPFEEGKNYNDYKGIRKKIIKVKYIDGDFRILD